MSQTFPVFVPYTQPTYEELEKKFDSVRISSSEIENVYDNCGYYVRMKVVNTVFSFIPMDECKDVSCTPREVVFTYLTCTRDMSTTEAVKIMAANGLRPALYEELLAFTDAYPSEQRRHEIVALGSRGDGTWWIYAKLNGFDQPNFKQRYIGFGHFSGEFMAGPFGNGLRKGTRCLVTKIGS